MSDMIHCSVMSFKEDSTTESSERAEFEGVITSSRVDHHYEHFSLNALKQMAKGADKGVKVLSEHNAGAQPIGKSISARYDASEEKVYSKFYIQKGLNLRAGFNAGDIPTRIATSLRRRAGRRTD